MLVCKTDYLKSFTVTIFGILLMPPVTEVNVYHVQFKLHEQTFWAHHETVHDLVDSSFKAHWDGIMERRTATGNLSLRNRPDEWQLSQFIGAWCFIYPTCSEQDEMSKHSFPLCTLVNCDLLWWKYPQRMFPNIQGPATSHCMDVWPAFLFNWNISELYVGLVLRLVPKWSFNS